ncbi:MAG: hypothetical protein ACFB0G_11665 [Leptolyngbyaceae cyanobacterium]
MTFSVGDRLATVTGGSRDIFVLATGEGSDTILDFEDETLATWSA